MTSSLEAAIESLKENPGQWEAFNTPGHCVVIAPPGSGKTHLLATRIGSDLLSTPLPHGAACITLTNPAAQELSIRFQELGIQYRSTLFLGTVHSFALAQVIRPFSRLSRYRSIASSRIATAKQLENSYKRAIQEIGAGGISFATAQKRIEYHRKKMTSLAEWEELEDQLHQIARRQRQLLRLVDLTDFEEVVAVAVRLVRDYPLVKAVMRARFPRIYVDEYQDLAPGLDSLVRELCLTPGEGSTLFAVGDPDQAIFGWTGAKPDLLAQLEATDGVHSVPLERNYRCGDAIIKAANLLRPSAAERPIRGNPGGKIIVRRVHGPIRDQAGEALSRVREAIAGGTSLHDIALVCPTNRECREVAAVLDPTGFAYFVRSDAYRATPSTLLIESLAAWVSRGRESGRERLVTLFDRWRTIMGEHATFAARVGLTEVLLRSTGDDLVRGFIEGIASSGLIAALRSAQTDDLHEFERMRRSAEKGELASMSVSKLGQRAAKQDRIEITTLTSCKGLEFDLVFVLGADQERIPHYNSLVDEERLCEDRRKFYVAITRARKEVQIYYSGYVWTPDDPNKKTGPSVFLQEMGFTS